MKIRIYNNARQISRRQSDGITIILRNDAPTEPVEMRIFETIGEDPWTGSGLTSEKFADALNQIPRNRDLHLLINSTGGDVWEGMSIKNMLEEWPGKVTTTIVGVAASTASWIGIGSDEVRMYKDSQMFVHDAWGVVMGNAQDMQDMAARLDKTSNQIAGMYARRAGKTVDYMRQLMRENTLMTGEEAKAAGLVDVLLEDGKAVQNFTPGWLDLAKTKLAALNSATIGKPSDSRDGARLAAQTNTPLMNKDKMIALLNKWGVAVPENATDEQLESLVAAGRPQPQPSQSADVKQLQDQINKLSELNALAERQRITAEVDALVSNNQLEATLRDKSIDRCMKDKTFLDELKARQPNKPGGDPLPSGSLEITSESFRDVQKFVLENSSGFRNQMIGANPRIQFEDRSDEAKKIAKEISARAFASANAIAKNKETIKGMWNSNAIDTALKRQVILQDSLEEYAIVLANLNIFSTVYNNVPLEGTDKVIVPFFPLQATASNSFDPSTGYATASDWQQTSREILIGGDGTSSGSSAAANTAKDRLYQMINFTSYDLRRLPYLNLAKLAQQAGNKLGVDIFTQVVSRVITATNFAASVKTVPAAQFVADDVADLRGSCTALNWPQMGRNLVMDHTYYTSLLKDSAFKQYLAYGSSDPIRLGRIENAYGFENIVEVPNLSSYSPTSENLRGWVNHKSAVLFATSPIMPTEEVRLLLTVYDLVVDPKTGATLEHRKFASATLDKSYATIECSFGAEKGVATALRRFDTPA